MSDVSDGGARLEFPTETQLPSIFPLSLTETGSVLRFCEIRWTRGNAVGVRFVRPKTLRQSRG
jgi:hypothetical protein